ncbi:MAG: cellulase family glycosylhydrolase [Clostridiales bacterium]|nr:cellulase family glycosylhydrolase [Clostridiales bacterium]
MTKVLKSGVIILTAVILAVGIFGISKIKSEVDAEAAQSVYCQNDIDINVWLNGSWQENKSFCYSYEITAENKTGKSLTNWQLKLTFDENTEILHSWNGNFITSGDVIIATSLDYNRVVKSGEVLKIGFNCKSSLPTEIVSAVLYENGKAAGEYGTVGETCTEAYTEISTETIVVERTGNTPYEKYGKLSVIGKNLVGADGNPVTLQGVSTHGIAWFPQYIDKEGFKTLRDNMNTDVIRLAVYSGVNEGYSKDLYEKVDEGVSYAQELGMYAIIDWHVLENRNPNTDKKNAKEFFTYMAQKYCDSENVLYEICNEPNGDVQWERDIRPYAEEIINIIRQYDDDGIIIVGTPTWSQDVDIAAQSPIENQTNIMYAFHFYAATHGEALRNKLSSAVEAGLPVFVTEFGISEASGNGSINKEEAAKWISFLHENNISCVCWNLSNKNEVCALINPECNKTSNWNYSELTDSGKWLFDTYNNAE